MNPFIESQRNTGQTPINQGVPQPSQSVASNPVETLQAFKAFMQNFKGNPEAQVKQMLASGQIDQSALDNAIAQAKQFKSMLGM